MNERGTDNTIKCACDTRLMSRFAVSFAIDSWQVALQTVLTSNIHGLLRRWSHVQIWLHASARDHPDVLDVMRREFNSLPIHIAVYRYELAPRHMPLMSVLSACTRDVGVVFCRELGTVLDAEQHYAMREFMMAPTKTCHIVRSCMETQVHTRLAASNFGCQTDWFQTAVQSIRWAKVARFSTVNRWLNRYIYPLAHTTNKLMVHTDLVAFQLEDDVRSLSWDTSSFRSPNSFVVPVNALLERSVDELSFLDRIRVMCEIERFAGLSEHRRYKMLTDVIEEALASDLHDVCLFACSRFQWTHVDDAIIRLSNRVINAVRTKGEIQIVGTTDPNRRPRHAKEWIICFGNYFHDATHLPCANPMRRHASYFSDVEVDNFEFHACWEHITWIRIINMIQDKDRWIETLLELCRMRAPLNRVRRVEGKRVTEPRHLPDSTLALIGCGAAHLDVVNDFCRDSTNVDNQANVLVLEDDARWSDQITVHQRDLRTFFDRKYEYDVCLLSTSKYWHMEPWDDLLRQTHQACTTGSAYLLSRSGAERVKQVFTDGLSQLIKTGNCNVYAIDRYWASLQKHGRFFVFKRKMCFQHPKVSNRTKQLQFNLD